jgi:NAD(P)-dependent dehydrogenase (short-subunit alcohol dehydrogenase family)
VGRVDGKVAIVTGAAGGIGAATARLLAQEGASVVVADINASGAEAHAARIVADGSRAVGIGFDLGDAASIESLIEQTVSRFGGIDVLHNNAAATQLAGTADGRVVDADPTIWDDTFRINVRGTALMIKAVVPHMLARGGGSIINTSSGAGLAGDLGHAAYGASKAAINAVTMYAATELGKQQVRVNAIAPGMIESHPEEGGLPDAFRQVMVANHLTPRLGTPDDIANAVLFLASDESTFVTGEILRVDGGVLAHQPYYSEMTATAAPWAS